VLNNCPDLLQRDHFINNPEDVNIKYGFDVAPWIPLTDQLEDANIMLLQIVVKHETQPSNPELALH